MDKQALHGSREAVAKHIRMHREAQGLSLRKLGAMTGLNYTYLSDIEHGNSSPTIDTLDKIANGLGISTRDLFD